MWYSVCLYFQIEALNNLLYVFITCWGRNNEKKPYMVYEKEKGVQHDCSASQYMVPLYIGLNSLLENNNTDKQINRNSKKKKGNKETR